MSSDEQKVRPQVPLLDQPVAAEAGDIPVLLDSEVPPSPGITEDQLTSVQVELTSLTHELADRLLDHAMRDMEAALVEQVSNRLREELPALIERVLRENLDSGD